MKVDGGLFKKKCRGSLRRLPRRRLRAVLGRWITSRGLRSDLECAEAVRSVDRWIRFGRLGFYVREIHQRPLDSNPRRRFVFGQIVTLALIRTVQWRIDDSGTFFHLAANTGDRTKRCDGPPWQRRPRH
jgi:hypothetical protein